MIPGNTTPEFFGAASAAAGGGAYSISRSLRFNSADSAYLSRTPASAGTSRRIFTLSLWFKRGTSSDGTFFSAGGDSDPAGYLAVSFSSDSINTFVRDSTTFRSATTTAVFRDYSAWYHLVYSVDTTQTTFATQQKLYINGTQITTWSASPVINQNTDLLVNHTNANDIGAARSSVGAAVSFFDGYMADVHMVDGQALDPTSFGEFDATTAVWNPIEYTGSYGTNGFHLDFADNASTTTIGYDAAGSNDWTANNLSVTAGSGNDSLVDVPTNGSQTDTGVGGEVRGNYCTLNPLNTGDTHTLSNGNLDTTLSGSTSSKTSIGTIGVSSGKWYYEATVGSGGSGYYPGFGFDTNPLPGSQSGSNATGYLYMRTGEKFNNSTLSSYGSSFTSGDVIGVALNLDAGTIIFYKNGVSQGQAFSSISGTALPVVIGFSSGGASMNFGQRPFAYTAPSGFKALCTANLTTPLVVKPNTVMDVSLYTGNGSTQTISGLGFSPDLVWIKSRSNASGQVWTDIVRGVGKELQSNSTAAETTDTVNFLTAFNSNGFSVGSDAAYNGSSRTYVAWTWDAGSSTVTNTAGSITSTVRANATAGFSVITATTTNTSSQTFGHGLGVAPVFHIIKLRNGTDDWYVYHSSVGATQYLKLNATTAATTSSALYANTAPTSSVITLGSGWNSTSYNIVCYAFAPVVGYSSFGSYTGNGSGSPDGPFIYTGFRPRWILFKNASTTNGWRIMDTSINPYNVVSTGLYPYLSNAEDSATNWQVDYLSNGFKVRSNSGQAEINGSGNTIIYAAFAESPFNYARAR